MSRPLRIEFPGACYHVMNRGLRRENVFEDAKDYQAFIDLLKGTSKMFRVGITAYCLMPNHYHLLLRTPEANLTRFMRHLGGVYTQLFNRRHDHDGPLFRGRYKALLVEEEEYLLGLVRYIHHNPIKADLVSDIKDHPWSSHPGYLSSKKQWDWLDKKSVLTRFSHDPTKAVKDYRKFMAQDDDEEIERVFSLRKLPAVLGSPKFVQKIKERFFSAKQNPEVPAAKLLAPSVQEITSRVCKAYGVDEKALRAVRRGVTNEARDVAVFLLRALRGERLESIAEILGIKTYSTVSSTLGRVENRLKNEADFRKRLEKIRGKLKKGHREICWNE